MAQQPGVCYVQLRPIDPVQPAVSWEEVELPGGKAAGKGAKAELLGTARGKALSIHLQASASLPGHWVRLACAVTGHLGLHSRAARH